MKIYNIKSNSLIDFEALSNRLIRREELFIICNAEEISLLQEVYNLDETTIDECTNLDEIIRYSNFEKYDFISMVYTEMVNDNISLSEINLYIFNKGIIIVVPENSPKLKQLSNHILELIKESTHLNKLYYHIFNLILTDYSILLESLEDSLESLHQLIINQVDKSQFTQISKYRQMAYTIRKQLRALSYLGEQILINENQLINKRHAHYFRNIDTRLKKLYDFAESLYELSNQLLYSYDSKVTMKTNEAINKLTILTVFFGPLTVITGIYGMNFKYMPELDWIYGYPMVLVVMLIIMFAIYVILKKKKWI